MLIQLTDHVYVNPALIHQVQACQYGENDHWYVCVQLPSGWCTVEDNIAADNIKERLQYWVDSINHTLEKGNT